MITGPARLGPLSDYTENYRPVLPSERAPYMKKQEIVGIKTINSGHWLQKGARHQVELADRPSVAISVQLQLPTSIKDRTVNSVQNCDSYRTSRIRRRLTDRSKLQLSVSILHLFCCLYVAYIQSDRLCGLVVRVLGYRS
jgi:hypothetical protein